MRRNLFSIGFMLMLGGIIVVLVAGIIYIVNYPPSTKSWVEVWPRLVMGLFMVILGGVIMAYDEEYER